MFVYLKICYIFCIWCIFINFYYARLCFIINNYNFFCTILLPKNSFIILTGLPKYFFDLGNNFFLLIILSKYLFYQKKRTPLNKCFFFAFVLLRLKCTLCFFY